MHTTPFISSNAIRTQFTRAMSEMYQLEVPLYKKLLSMAEDMNKDFIEHSASLNQNETQLLDLEHHGAIRVGSAAELSQIRRLFKVMGMHPVDYYDLSVAGIPVHSTAFRAIKKTDLNTSPFRVFCSLLRLDLIHDKQLQELAKELLGKRQIFPKELLNLIDIFEKQGGLSANQASDFIQNALEVFRWHQHATVDKETYLKLKEAHGLIADIVSFKGPHINHLTPKVLDIDACQDQFSLENIKAKAVVEGPPKRDCPILLRQTSFIAVAENVTFSDDEAGTHTARFGEIEQRGVALTPKGRTLYDKLLSRARNDDSNTDYMSRLNEAFEEFPDTYAALRQQNLAYFTYSPNLKNGKLNQQPNDIEELISAGFVHVSPITYEDFLPVSAAGIFSSNLTNENNAQVSAPLNQENPNRKVFEEALGVSVLDSFELYENRQSDSLNKTLEALGLNGFTKN